MKKHVKKRFLEKYNGKKYGWYLMARDFVLTLLGVFLVFSLFVGVSQVNGGSMEPTLSNGDAVFFTRLNFSYNRGDVVFARMPSGSNYVKRIVAVAGDVVDLKDGVLYVNGAAEDAAYLQGQTLPQQGIVEYPFTVAPGRYFLVGDNRTVSVDSRSFGSLPESSLKGKLLFVD